MDRRAFTASTALPFARTLGANDRVRAAIIGSGGRGRYLTANFKEVGAEVGGVCDVYEPNLAAGLKAASTGALGFDNYKRVLDDKSFDVVIVATPDHWHARMVVDAVEAGKDVYVEKPLAHKIHEGFTVVEATRRTKRIVQVGTQRRSSELFQEAREIARSGALGEVRLVNSWWLNHQKSLSPRKLEGKLDWKQWLGSAPERTMNDQVFFNWYYFWDYSGGLMIGQAAHIVDCVQWFLNASIPRAVSCAGMNHLDGAEVPETTSMALEFPEDFLSVFTLGYKAMRYAGINDQMNQFHGSQARFDVGRESYALYRESNSLDMKAEREKRLPGSFDSATRAHIRNFLECVRSRKEPNAPVEAGNATNVALCMAMEALRTGRRVRWNSATRRTEA